MTIKLFVGYFIIFIFYVLLFWVLPAWEVYKDMHEIDWKVYFIVVAIVHVFIALIAGVAALLGWAFN